MAGRSSILVRVAGLVAVAVVGGAVALGGAALFGGLGDGTTTVREVEGGSLAPAAVDFEDGEPLSIKEIYRRSAPGVVQVTSTTVETIAPDPFFPFAFPEQRRQRALGSGFVIDKAGHVVTNYHVIQGARIVEVSFSNNESMKARIVGSDPSTDIAVLKVKAPSRALTPLPLGDSDSLSVGDAVVAIGNPFGLERSISAGIVSALQRPLTSPSGDRIDHVIQTDAAINRGSSGGPLLNAEGEVVGVNSAIATGSDVEQGNVGIGFAVPINTVKDVAAQLIETGKVEHPFLGVRVRAIEPELARLFRLPVRRGLMVEVVLPDSGAEDAGLKGGTTQVVVAGESYVLGGDIIVEADGRSLSSLDKLRDVIRAKEPGDKVSLEIYRGEKKMSVEVELGRQPTSPSG